MKRRGFLQHGSLATAGTLLIPKFLQAFYQEHPQAAEGKILVVIQLSGGNDGLNTVIPFQNDVYYQLRPRLAIEKDKVLQLSDTGGLHPSLSYLRECYHNGELTILNEVGYPNPDRSHFRSMDIWHTASKSNEYLETGWLGRYLDAACSGCAQPTQILELDDVLSLAMKGSRHKGLAFRDPRQLYATSNSKAFEALYQQHQFNSNEQLVNYLYRTLGDTMQSAENIMHASRKHPSLQVYPDSGLGKSLKTIGSLIGSASINTRVYYASHGSFDTHVNQQFQQQRLLTELNDALAAFVKDLKQQNRFKDVLIMTFSEFGRRVAQNASGGTDHGTANNLMLIGGSLKKTGFFNSMPSLQDLENGDLTFKIDFRDVYNTILTNWLGADAGNILHGRFGNLQFV